MLMLIVEEDGGVLCSIPHPKKPVSASSRLLARIAYPQTRFRHHDDRYRWERVEV